MIIRPSFSFIFEITRYKGSGNVKIIFNNIFEKKTASGNFYDYYNTFVKLKAAVLKIQLVKGKIKKVS
jgi:hypothetical protein